MAIGGRKTPNANVLIELGYAIATVGWNRIILVFNEASGDVTDLPFDINQQRVARYNSAKRGAAHSVKKTVTQFVAQHPQNVLSASLQALTAKIDQAVAEERKQRTDQESSAVDFGRWIKAIESAPEGNGDVVLGLDAFRAATESGFAGLRNDLEDDKEYYVSLDILSTQYIRLRAAAAQIEEEVVRQQALQCRWSHRSVTCPCSGYIARDKSTWDYCFACEHHSSWHGPKKSDPSKGSAAVVFFFSPSFYPMVICRQTLLSVKLLH